MKIVISSLGKFTSFYLAEQLNLRGVLQKLLTGYPGKKYPGLSFFMKDSGRIPREKIKTFLWPTVLSQVSQRIPRLLSRFSGVRLADMFDGWASRQLEPCDLVVPFASYGLKTIRQAQSMGIPTVLERGSAHVETETNLVREEQQRWGVPWSSSPPEEIERQLQEYEEADYIEVPSRYAKDSLVSQGIRPEKILVSPLGVDLAEFHPVPKLDGRFRIIYAGWLNFRKGILYLLEALRRLQLKEAELWLFGEVSPEMEVPLQKYQGLFRHFGAVPQHHLYRHYSQGSVFVLPTISDGFGLVLLQAMACGLPVITTTNSGGPDLIEEGKEGFLVPIRDISALAEKILFLYENPAIREQMGTAARARAQRDFSWSSYGDRVVKTYADLFGKIRSFSTEEKTP